MTSSPVSFSLNEWERLLGVAPPSTWPLRISGLQADSRLIRPGELFIAISGTQSDGHGHIAHAIRRGAIAVITERDGGHSESVPSIQVSSSRRALARISQAFYQFPDKELKLIGVTGTNGKTSVTRFIQHIFEVAERSAGSLGTVGYTFAGRVLPARRTTPSGPELHRILAEMHRAACEVCVMEVSSHALDQDRVFGLEYDTTVFTNLSQDHLDYHETMESYFEAKSRLFDVESLRTRIVGEDPWSQRLADRFGSEVIRCGLGKDCQVRAEHIESTLTGTVAEVSTPWGDGTLRISLPGEYNLRNTLQAIAVAASEGIDFPVILTAAETLKAAPGRMQLIQGSVGRIYVDYAHTPDALGSVLSLLKRLAKGRVVVVFGCGGDRDRIKRPLMVEAAGAYADEMIFTLDNPRSENPDQIFADMKEGVTSEMTVRIEPDRKEAIRSAVLALKQDDVLLIAGKGHETFQEIGSVQIPFDDREVAMRTIAERNEAVDGDLPFA